MKTADKKVSEMTMLMSGLDMLNQTPRLNDGTDADLCDVCFWKKRAAQSFEGGLKKALDIINARYMGDNNREDEEVKRCADDIRAALTKHRMKG